MVIEISNGTECGMVLRLVLVLACLRLAISIELFVSPTGQDTNSGTSQASALQTLQRARDLAAGSPSTIHVASGTYQLTEPLSLGAEHSNARWIAEGPASIRGSRALTSWYPLSSNSTRLQIVKADVSALGLGAQSRHLFVHGRRARRSRLPQQIASSIFSGSKLTDYGFQLLPKAKVPQVQAGAEFVFPRSTSVWTEPRCAVSFANTSHIVMMQPCWQNLMHKPCKFGVKGAPVGNAGYVENAGAQYLSQPGDWALDSETHTAYYALREGESADTLTAEMPVLELLLNITGADHVEFEGFTFEYATWLRPGQSEGFVDHQGGNCLLGTNRLNYECDADGPLGAEAYWSRKSPGNIAVVSSSHIRFSRCEFSRLGAGAAVDITAGNSCQVVNSFVHDVSGAAVQIGGFTDPLATSDSNNSVVNTIVHKAAVEFRGAVGINVGFTQGTVLWGNDVSNVSWTGISMGWGWNRHRCWNCTASRDNVIAFNRVHDFKLDMNDGGGIYMLGPQNGSWVHDNWVYDEALDRGDVGAGGGLYPDDGSAYFVFSHNVVSRMKNFWLFLWTHSIHDIAIENNFATPQKTFDAGARCPLVNNSFFNMTQIPLAAKRIMAASGVNSSNPWLRRLQLHSASLSAYEYFV